MSEQHQPPIPLNRALTRRHVLQGTALAGVAAFLAACGTAAQSAAPSVAPSQRPLLRPIAGTEREPRRFRDPRAQPGC